jgi:type IV secretory pathway VirB4 component
MEALTSEIARKTVKNYCCSNCWGDLEITTDMRENDMYFVICQKCQDETKGYVTKYFANQRRNQSEFEKRDVTRLLQKLEIIPNPRKGMTREDMIKELGY